MIRSRWLLFYAFVVAWWDFSRTLWPILTLMMIRASVNGVSLANMFLALSVSDWTIWPLHVARYKRALETFMVWRPMRMWVPQSNSLQLPSKSWLLVQIVCYVTLLLCCRPLTPMAQQLTHGSGHWSVVGVLTMLTTIKRKRRTWRQEQEQEQDGLFLS